TELEDLSFFWLHPEQFRAIDEKLQQVRQERQRYIDEVIELLGKAAEENEIPAQVSGRIKHHYSIFHKMKLKAVDFDQIYDIIAFRILTQSVGDCYRVLGLIHAMWKPVAGRFKDYIAMPKINRYQSLHTTVLGPGNERVEIQIRTEEMHRVAEQGVAAHWVYKEGGGGPGGKELTQFAWLRELLEQHKDVRDPQEFLETVKVDLFSDEVFVFTPQGDVKAMPHGATALDFAYSVHSEVGHHCVGAKLNGKIAPLRQKLKNGDTVEILTNPKQKPSKDWLGFVKTSRAKNKIRAVIRAEQRKRSEEIGREILEKECKRQGVNLARAWRAGEVTKAAQQLGFKDVEEMLIRLGYGRLATIRVIELLLPPDKAEERREAEQKNLDEQKPSRITQIFKRPGRKSKSGILVEGLDDVLVRFAKCCNPIPGDPLVGVITRGRGVTIHNRGCRRVASSDQNRLIEVKWDSDQAAVHSVSIRVLCEDRPGMLANISNILSERGININQVSSRPEDGGRATISLRVTILNLEQLNDVIRRLGRVKGVLDAERVLG
ncbi:MAG TPA: RelA/SpoT family protein, partial [Myxococcota bacterium]|nr:RelA/SpoT family protein [Myxococcota bacterium]